MPIDTPHSGDRTGFRSPAAARHGAQGRSESAFGRRRADPKQPAHRAGSARGTDAKPLTITAADDDVVRVEFSDGSVMWSRADDLLREHGRARIGRHGVGGGWSIDSEFRPHRRSEVLDASAERGALGLAITALELFGVDVSGVAAGELGRRLERSRLGREPGLYQVRLVASPPTIEAIGVDDGLALPDVPMLIFLHGTMSSLLGSFGDLLTGTDPGASQRALRTAGTLRRAHLRVRAPIADRKPDRQCARPRTAPASERPAAPGFTLARRSDR